MCLSPIRISKPANPSSPLRKLYDARLSLQVRSSVAKTSRNVFVVPCGKCVECLKRKQNDIATRVVREAERVGSMVFVTLTYKESALPLAHSVHYYDFETGDACGSLLPVSGRFSLYVHNSIVFQPISRKPRYFDDVDYDDDTGCVAVHTYTPSLCRRDVRLYMKRKRIEHERFYGEKLPDMKYLLVGEYGPKTCRPHYHLCIIGWSAKLAREFFADWHSVIGDVEVKQVKYINDDKTFGFVIASKYVGKYMVKGKSECESVRDGFAEKPRICISRDFGVVLTDKEIAYYRAYDMFGWYNPNDISHFADWQLRSLCEEIDARARVNIYGYKYALPNGLKKRLFYRKIRRYDKLQKKVVVAYEATQLQNFRTALLQVEFADNLLAQLRQVDPNVLAETFSLALQMALAKDKVDKSLKRQTLEKDFSRFYDNSVF